MRLLPSYIQPIVVETHDGLNQTVHPDVIRNIQNGTDMYIMSITPYPFGDYRYENPCVYISLDGLDWFAPEGIDNPLALPEASGWDHLSDLRNHICA